MQGEKARNPYVRTFLEKYRQCQGLFFEIRATMPVLSLDNETYIVLSAKLWCWSQHPRTEQEKLSICGNPYVYLDIPRVMCV